jgi:hypothetical protein
MRGVLDPSAFFSVYGLGFGAIVRGTAKAKGGTISNTTTSQIIFMF